jgi:excisionase family DNA binding protein
MPMKHGVGSTRKSAFSVADGTLTITEASEFLLLGEDSVRALIESGDLPALKLNPKHLLVLESNLLDFIRERVRAQTQTRRNALQHSTYSKVFETKVSPATESGYDGKQLAVTRLTRRGRARNPIPALS